jgi:hypothetical protein
MRITELLEAKLEIMLVENMNDSKMKKQNRYTGTPHSNG